MELSNSTRIKVNGEIINELSEKIPSNIVAINELIKNAYDADAGKIIIDINTTTKKMVITDDGCGISVDQVSELFHLSHSNKSYGVIRENGRYTQGSKGLGFLAVFRFGNYVTWKTNTGNGGIQFSVDKNKLVELSDITEYVIDIIPNMETPKGTTIEIDMNGIDIESIKKDFNDSRIVSKIINGFLDKGFMTIFNIDGVNTQTIDNKEIITIPHDIYDKQIFHITFSSDEEVIHYDHKDFKAFDVAFDFHSRRFSCKINLFAFKLVAGDPKKFPSLFQHPNTYIEQITPIVYINNNLFNNYEIFDPNVLRGRKNTETLPQLIGFIQIYSSDPELKFNSDRTQFTQTSLTAEIVEFLRSLNMKVQLSGAERKAYLPEMNFYEKDIFDKSRFYNEQELQNELVNNIKGNFKFKDQITIEINEDSAHYKIWCYDKNIKLENEYAKAVPQKPIKLIDPLKPHKIENETENDLALSLIKDYEELPLYNDLIKLEKYISKALYSDGSAVNLSDVEIRVDGEAIRELSSITQECIKVIEYTLNDSNTNSTIKKKLTIKFHEIKSAVAGEKVACTLISYPSSMNYTVNYHYAVNNLINQINILYSSNEYTEVIACSLRTIFELSVDSITSSLITIEGFNDLKSKLSITKHLQDKVGEIVSYIKTQKITRRGKTTSILSEIANQLKTSYNTLENRLNVQEYTNSVAKSNLATHKATDQVSITDIEDLGKKIGCFVVCVNELLKL